MLYTSYFANIKKLPNNIIPISISLKSPKWYKGFEYKKLAPSYNILVNYKTDYDEVKYIERFNDEILSKLDASQVISELNRFAGGSDKNIVLLCYETPLEFCHRHLVAKWLNKNGCLVHKIKI